MTQFKHAIAVIALSTSALISGCATTPDTPTSDAPYARPTPTSKPDKAGERLVRPFDRDTLYELLVAEFAGKRNRADLALGKYHKQAHQTRDLGVIERANAIARYLGSHQVTLDTAMLWLEVDPTSTPAREIAASQYIRSGQLDKAMELIEELLALDIDVQFEFLLQGLDQTDARMREQVLRDLELINQRYPGREQLWFTKGVIEQRMELQDAALVSFQHAININPGYVNAIIAATNLMEDMGLSAESLTFLAGKVRELPKNRNLGINYARRLIRANRLEEAQKEFGRLVALYPNDPELILSLALLAWENKQVELAKAQFSRLIELNQRRDEAHQYLGKILAQEGEFDQARGHFLQVSIGAHFTAARIQLAMSLHEQGRMPEAQHALAQARELAPRFAEQFYLAEIELLSKDEDYAKALSTAERALAEQPESLSLLYSRALLLIRFDRFAEMEQDLRAILAQQADHPAALNALGYTLADRNERLEEAYELINKAYELSPEDPAIIDSLGWVAYRLGDLERAINLLQKAYERFPDQEVAAHLGEVLWVNGQTEQAQSIWQEGLQRTPNSKIIRDTMNRLLQD